MSGMTGRKSKQTQPQGLTLISIPGRAFLLSISLGTLISGLSGCTNSALQGLQNRLSSSQNTTTTTSTTSGTTSNPDKLTISTVAINAVNAATPDAVQGASLYFDTVKSTANISAHCNASSGSVAATKPCLCQFAWTEINQVGDTNSPIPHQVRTPLLTVQPNAITCGTPGLYATEIPNGTSIKITVIPGPNNANAGLFSVSTVIYTKNPTTTTGNFTDALGRSFVNITHYSCHNRFRRGLSIESASKVESNPNSAATGNAKTKTLYYGSAFCAAKSASTGDAPSTGVTCPTLTQDYSAQAYYFNFYIRNTESGGINRYNDGYTCPMVREPLNPSFSGVGNNGQIGQFWPMDQTFALSVGKTADFSQGLVSNSKLSSSDDPTNVSSTCDTVTGATATTAASSSGVTTSCLGFAAKVNSDGTCPFLKNSSGQLQPTFRLRKYVAIYPKLYDTDGTVVKSQTQAVDTVYVLDRPVTGPSNADPYKPYTMKGPKPCPFAFYDRKGVTNILGQPKYLGTSNPLWTGVNVDGIEFPNTDSEISKSCSATLPVPVRGLSGEFSHWGLRTINKRNATFNHLYVRPITAFTPHYEEDMTFQACAPQASPFLDPPLHFSSYPAAYDSSGTPIADSAGNSYYNAWCSESYPTQNDNLTGLLSGMDSGKANNLQPYTSHLAKGTTSSTCTATAPHIPSGYSGLKATHNASVFWDVGTANHTCDRTTIANSASWAGTPLLAPPGDVETALRADYSYRCTVSYDNNGPKTGTSEPKEGCCKAGIITASPPFNAHLEPDKSCGTPKY